MYSDKVNKQQLTLAIDESASRSITPMSQPPSPGQFMMMNEGASSGDGDNIIDSQFGRAKKPKRKAAPRTSRACLACRRQKMRCEGANDPPCQRCIANGVDCMFERRSDYLLNPEDRAWQNGVEKRLEHLGRAIDQILAHLGGAMTAPMPHPHTAAGGFPEMPGTAYYEQFTDARGHQHAGPDGMVPQTAPPMGAGEMADSRINYVIPTPAETAAIAAQTRFKRPRGNTMPGNLPSAGFTPTTDAAFQLFSPRTAFPEQNDANGQPTGYAFPGTSPSQSHLPGPSPSPNEHPHAHQHVHHHQHQHGATPEGHGGHHNQNHPNNHGHNGQAGLSHPSAYSLDTYPAGSSTQDLQVAVPRSLNSPGTVRFAAQAPVPLLHAPPQPNGDGPYSHSATPESMA